MAALSLAWSFTFDTLVNYRFGWGVNEEVHPVAAVDFMDANPLPENLYSKLDLSGDL